MAIMSMECPCNVMVMSQHCYYVLPLCAMLWQCRDISLMLLMFGVDVATLNFGVLSPSINVMADVVTLQVQIISI